MSFIKEIEIDITKDIILNIKPYYGSSGSLRCNVMNKEGDTNRVLDINDLDKIDKHKYIISKDHIENKQYIVVYITLLPMKNKSKKKLDIVLLQDKNKIVKKTITETNDTIIFKVKRI